VAQAFADYLLNIFSSATRRGVAIGFDGRDNSALFARSFAEVLSGNGIMTHLSDKIVPTPFTSYFVRNANLDAGVMLTASHNPPNYNGVKFKKGNGAPFSTEQTKEVESLIGKSAIRSNSSNLIVTDFEPPYFKHIDQVIDFNAIITLTFAWRLTRWAERDRIFLSEY
jgi:phosphomannomutase